MLGTILPTPVRVDANGLHLPLCVRQVAVVGIHCRDRGLSLPQDTSPGDRQPGATAKHKNFFGAGA